VTPAGRGIGAAQQTATTSQQSKQSTPRHVAMNRARRLDKAASRYTAMLKALQEIGRAMAWTWLRVQAHNEQRGNGEGE